jgi:hypothetical protein
MQQQGQVSFYEAIRRERQWEQTEWPQGSIRGSQCKLLHSLRQTGHSIIKSKSRVQGVMRMLLNFQRQFPQVHVCHVLALLLQRLYKALSRIQAVVEKQLDVIGRNLVKTIVQHFGPLGVFGRSFSNFFAKCLVEV